jgi:hypothetical protein
LFRGLQTSLCYRFNARDGKSSHVIKTKRGIEFEEAAAPFVLWQVLCACAYPAVDEGVS